jgi:hypothetical protein
MTRDVKYWLGLFAIVAVVATVTIASLPTPIQKRYERVQEGMRMEQVEAALGTPAGGIGLGLGGLMEWQWSESGVDVWVVCDGDGIVKKKRIDLKK